MTSDEFFEYTQLNEIHYVRLLSATGPAVQAVLKHLEAAVVEKPIDGKNRVLVDFRTSGPPSMIESLPHVVGFFARQPQRTPQFVRVAYVYPSNAQGRVLKGFLTIQRLIPQGMASKFFSEADYEKALEWLRL